MKNSDISSNRLNEVFKCIPQPLLPISKWQTVKCLGIQNIYLQNLKYPKTQTVEGAAQEVGSGDGEENLEGGIIDNSRISKMLLF